MLTNAEYRSTIQKKLAKMVLITENTVKIIRMPEVQTKRMVSIPRATEIKKDEPQLAWKYITVKFAEYNNQSYNYGLLLKYMLQTVKSDPIFKYNVMFQILPIVLHHKDGMYYLVLRIRVRKEILKDHGDFVANVITRFNMTHGKDYQMAVEINPMSMKYLYELYTTEYIHTGRNPQHPPPLSPRFREQPMVVTMESLSPITPTQAPVACCQQPRYALATMQREPPMPPMPKTFDIAVSNDYYHQLILINEGLRRMQHPLWQ